MRFLYHVPLCSGPDDVICCLSRKSSLGFDYDPAAADEEEHQASSEKKEAEWPPTSTRDILYSACVENTEVDDYGQVRGWLVCLISVLLFRLSCILHTMF